MARDPHRATLARWQDSAISSNTDVASAARNNAEWCDIVCHSHGNAGEFHPHFWASRSRTPPRYPDAVTLDPEATAEGILEIVDAGSPGCSVKDSFDSLDLSPFGFRILFEADWITRSQERPIHPDVGTVRWRPVRDAGALQAWEAAWSGDQAVSGLFRPALLDHASVSVLGGYLDDRVVAGAIANRSPDVVGVSNLFTTTGDLAGAWSGCLEALAGTFPPMPIVGYESGDALAAAREAGFKSLGRLRVWIKEVG